MESQINSLETRIEKMQERFNKDLEEIKKSQYIMNNAINEIKNTLEATNSRITEAEDRISELEDRMVEINESERIKEKRIKRNEDNLRDLQDNIKHYNIRIIGVPEEEDKKKDHKKILEEIIVENFPKMGKEIITQVQETQRVPINAADQKGFLFGWFSWRKVIGFPGVGHFLVVISISWRAHHCNSLYYVLHRPIHISLNQAPLPIRS